MDRLSTHLHATRIRALLVVLIPYLRRSQVNAYTDTRRFSPLHTECILYSLGPIMVFDKITRQRTRGR